MFPVGDAVGLGGVPTGLAGSDCVAAKDCSGLDLTGADFAGRDLTGVKFIDTDLTKAIFGAGTWQKRLDLSGVDFTGATLTGAYLGFTDLRKATLTSADLSSADLTAAFLDGQVLTGVKFIDANLEHALFTGADIRGADFTNAKLMGVDFSRTYDPYPRARWGDNSKPSLLEREQAVAGFGDGVPSSYPVPLLAGIILTGADLTGARLSGTYWLRPDLTGADLTGANLGGVDWAEAKLAGAKLIGVRLAGGNGRARIVFSDFTDATLTLDYWDGFEFWFSDFTGVALPRDAFYSLYVTQFARGCPAGTRADDCAEDFV